MWRKLWKLPRSILLNFWVSATRRETWTTVRTQVRIYCISAAERITSAVFEQRLPANIHYAYCVVRRPRFARWCPQRQSHLHFWRGGLEKRTIEEEEACRWTLTWQLGPSVPSGDAVYHRTTNLLNVLIHQNTQRTLFKTCGRITASQGAGLASGSYSCWTHFADSTLIFFTNKFFLI